jgi:hypothetical protein
MNSTDSAVLNFRASDLGGSSMADQSIDNKVAQNNPLQDLSHGKSAEQAAVYKGLVQKDIVSDIPVTILGTCSGVKICAPAVRVAGNVTNCEVSAPADINQLSPRDDLNSQFGNVTIEGQVFNSSVNGCSVSVANATRSDFTCAEMSAESLAECSVVANTVKITQTVDPATSIVAANIQQQRA